MTARMTAAEYKASAKHRPSKYRNQKVTVAGETFDSKREYARYIALFGRQQRGEIYKLERQPAFVLAPGVRLEGEKRAKPAIRYVADFLYLEGNALIVEDVKSAPTAKTAAFRLKLHLMKSVHGIDVRVIR